MCVSYAIDDATRQRTFDHLFSILLFFYSFFLYSFWVFSFFHFFATSPFSCCVAWKLYSSWNVLNKEEAMLQMQMLWLSQREEREIVCHFLCERYVCICQIFELRVELQKRATNDDNFQATRFLPFIMPLSYYMCFA